MAEQRMFAGTTPPGETPWQQYHNGSGVFVIVDTSAARFKATPAYVISIGGYQSHWSTTGGSAVYKATRNGFWVFLRWADGGRMSPASIATYGWHVNWIGLEYMEE